MKRNRFLLLYLSFIPLIGLTGCDLFENGNISDYIGVYRSNGGVEIKKHYYWGQTTVVSESTIFGSGMILTINTNKKVTLEYSDGSIETGRIKVYKEYAKFTGMPFSSSYKFKRTKENGLSYQYTEEKYGLEYDFVTRSIHFSFVRELQ